LTGAILGTERDAPLPLDVVEYSTIIRQASEQMDSLIRDLLDVTRIEAGQLRVSLRQVDPRRLVLEALDGLRPLAELAGVTLHESYDEDLPEVNADPERITQVLSNVVGNALKFTPSGGRVSVAVRRGSSGAVVTVADTGEGIPAEELPRIFDRFFQVAREGRAGPRQGAGLGLPIARGIMEAHGGSIRVESDHGAGSIVTIELPT
jgi:signal transduction histidine kinase